MVAQKCKAPTIGAAKALRRIMAYLNGTADRKLEVPRVNGNSYDFYVDSDHAGDREQGKQSRSGYIAYLNGVPIDWMSKKQCVTSIGSAEAEIYALSEAIKRAKLIQWTSDELGIKAVWPLRMGVDNKACISFQQGTNPDSRLTGVFDLREEWVRELKQKDKVVTIKVDTKYNTSDLFTKCHERARFAELCELVRGKAHKARGAHRAH